MTKISSKTAYPKKNPIVADYFVGTDSEDFNKTVNFGFEEVAGLVNKLNGTPLLNYVFNASPYIDTEVLVEGRFLSLGSELNTPELTKLYVNKFNNSGDNLQELYLFLQTNATDFYLKLRNSNNQNNAVYFDIASIEDFPDYFILNISIFKENEFLPLLQNLNVYFFDFELKATAAGASDPLKLDKGGYEGTAQDLNNSIKNIAFPDQVLKIGEIVITGLNAFVSAGDFQWRLNQVDFLTAPEFSEDIDPATDGFNRTDILEGDNAGIIHLKKGTENEAAAPGPEVTTGRIILAGIPVFGSTVGTPILLPNYDDKYLKRYKSTYKTVQPIFNIEPSQDDYNVIFNNTTNSEIRIYENGHNGGFIKNGAIYPFKSLGIGNVTVINSGIGVIINAPNGLVLNKNQQCYLIKDDYNEWTLVNPRNLQNVDNTSDATKPVSGPQQTALDLKIDKVAGKGLSTEDYTPSEKNKLASIDATHYLAPLQTTVQLSALLQAGISDKARVYVENDLSDYFYDATATSGDIAPDDQAGGIGFWRKVAVGGETAASIKTKYESNADTNAFTDALKAKLDSITEIFTTALKSSYDSVVSGYTALIATGSRLITTGEITKLGNTSGTNTGDNATNTQYSGLAASKEDLANKQNSLAVDGTGTKYPTVDAVNAGMVYKQTIAQIRALTGTLPNTNLYTTDLGQEGNWYYDATDALSADNTGTILVTSDGKRIKRIFDNGVDIKWFGAKITNTATQNNTAIDLAIAWAISDNGGKIRIPTGTYLVNPIHVPYVGISAGRIVPIEIVGEVIPNQLFGTIGSYPLASSGSVLSCASTTAGQSVIVVDPHPTDFGNFSSVKPVIKNLDIRTYQNSQIGGIDARYAQQLVIENCQITNGGYSVDSVLPTYPNAVGLHTPDLDNAALTILKNVSISGFYTGLVVNEHTDGQGLNLTCNLNAMEFKQANHSSNFGMIDMQRNTIGMKFTGIHAVNIDNLNLEHAGDSQTTPANIWQKTTYDIDDASNNARGLINWHSVLGAAGTTPDDFRKNGGEKVKYINLYRAKTETASSTFGGEYKYNSDINTANSRSWRSKTDYPIAGGWSLQVAKDLPESLWTDVINATKEGRVDFNKSFSVSENVTASLAVTSFYLKNNNGTDFGESAAFLQTNNFAYLNIAPNQTNIYAYRAGGLRLATGNSRIVFANGNADLDASTEKIGIEATGVVKIANLSGIGTRLVYSDTYGNLSAPDVPTAPTAAPGTNTTQIANMAALQEANISKGIITTSISISNATLTDTSKTQESKTILISNGANDINYTINGEITASFVKGGSGTITFVQGSGRTMVGANGTLVFNGAVGSTASVVSFDLTDYVYINNL